MSRDSLPNLFNSLGRTDKLNMNKLPEMHLLMPRNI